jgi:hypothetical protein
MVFSPLSHSSALMSYLEQNVIRVLFGPPEVLKVISGILTLTNGRSKE